MKNYIISALAAVLCFFAAQARQLSVDEAVSAAMADSPARVRAQGNYSLAFKVEKSGLNTVYVVNTPSGGYMVLAADDVSVPVLGVSDRPFDPDNIPAAMRGWLNEYSSQIVRAVETGSRVVSAPADPSLADVAPITKTKWNQDEPYNDMCPRIDGQQTYSGCVATAIAQVMKIYEYPQRGRGTKSYQWNGSTLSLDFSDVTFDWTNMCDVYDGTQTPAQNNAVATLMYAAGIASEMDYGTGGSGAMDTHTAVGLVENFGYDRGLALLYRNYFPLPQWCRMIHSELAQGYAVYYGGSNDSDGHAFVLDGYRRSDGFFHVNWGWGGMSDGYFAITSLDPESQGIGGSNAGYADGQDAFLYLRPEQEGSEYFVFFISEGGLSTPQPSYSRNGNVSVMMGENQGIFNVSLAAMTAELGMRLKDAAGADTYVWEDGEPLNFDPDNGVYGFEIKGSSFPVSGTYTGTLVVRCNGKVYDVYPIVGSTPALKVECGASEIIFTPLPYVSELKLDKFTALSPVYRGKSCVLELTLSNTGEEYYGNIIARIVKGSRTEELGKSIVDVVKDGSETIRITGKVPGLIANGAAQIEILDELYNKLGSYDVTISTAPSGKPVVYLDEVRFPGATMNGDVAEFSGYDFNIDITARCTSAYYFGATWVWLFKGGEQEAFYRSNNLYLGENQTGVTTVSADVSDVAEQGTLYTVYVDPTEQDCTFEGTNTFHVRFGVNGGVTAPESGRFGISADRVTAPAPVKSLELFNLAGVRVSVFTFSGESTEESYAADLARGHYIARIVCSDGSSAVMKLAK